MWTEMDFYAKRDDDSAIGDSANNSAEEESSNPGRKSITSDDSSDLPPELHGHLSSKVGIQIPNCLLKETEKTQKDVTKNHSLFSDRKSKFTRNNTSDTTTHKLAPNRKKETRKGSNQIDLQLQLQYLLFEMKNLRELDRDILRKFVSLNDCIEEVRWRLADNEAKFQRNIAEDDAEDFFSTLTESRLGDWDDPNVTPNTEEEGFKKPETPVSKTRSFLYSSSSKVSQKKVLETSCDVQKSSTPTRSINLSRSSSARVEPSSSSLADPVYNHVGREEKIKETKKENPNERKTVQLEKLNEKNDHRLKSPHSTPSDVWTAREKLRNKEEPVKRRYSKDAATSSKKEEDNVKSTSVLTKKYNDLIQQKSTSVSRSTPRSASFRSPAEEAPKVNRRSQWQQMEKQIDTKVSDFRKQRDYQNLVGLSRVRGRTQVFQTLDQKSSQKSSDSSGSLNSTSSESSSSLLFPSRDSVTNGTGNKWSRFGSKTRSVSVQNSNNNSNLINAFQAPQSVATGLLPPQNVPVMLSRDLNVIAMPHKRTSQSSIYDWIRQQKDVSFF